MPQNGKSGANAPNSARTGKDHARAVQRTAKGGNNGEGASRSRVRSGSTRTSAFGVSKRESHDASEFYDSAMYRTLPKESEVGEAVELPERFANRVVCQDAREMLVDGERIPDNSVHLMVTSPPYNASKTYDEDLDLSEYLDLLKGVFQECWRVLVPGGRACINVANLGRKPYIPLASFINQIMLDIGFMQRGEVIWNKSASAGVSCTWGSWKSASNPTLRDVHEYILILFF